MKDTFASETFSELWTFASGTWCGNDGTTELDGVIGLGDERGTVPGAPGVATCPTVIGSGRIPTSANSGVTMEY